MKNTHLYFRYCLTSISIFLVVSVSIGCKDESEQKSEKASLNAQESNNENFTGDSIAIQKAVKMFEVLGGIEKWGNLKSLYIKAKHIQPNMKKPYRSEIWRDLDTLKLRIDQGNQEFHRIKLVSQTKGWLQDKKNDSTRMFTEEELKDYMDRQKKNIYVILKRLATAPYNYSVFNSSKDRIIFQKGDEYVVSFELDSLHRPYKFITLDNGREKVSVFNAWGESHGFLHPIEGGPENKRFTFFTKSWEPFKTSFEKAFEGVPYSMEE